MCSPGIDHVTVGGDHHLTSRSAPMDVEKLTLLGSSAINGTGNGLANTITGNAAANILDGGLGTDTLIGGAGQRHLRRWPTAPTRQRYGGIDTITSTITRSLASFATRSRS